MRFGGQKGQYRDHPNGRICIQNRMPIISAHARLRLIERYDGARRMQPIAQQALVRTLTDEVSKRWPEQRLEHWVPGQWRLPVQIGNHWMHAVIGQQGPHFAVITVMTNGQVAKSKLVKYLKDRNIGGGR